MTRKEAVKQLKSLLSHCESMWREDDLIWNDDCDALQIALAALTPPTKEQVEEAWPGCEYCTDDDCPPLDWQFGLDHILPDYRFCPMCGRPLTPAAWEEMRKRREEMIDGKGD